MMAIQSLEVFAYVTFRPCGCACQCATPRVIDSHLRDEGFIEAMNSGCSFRAVSEEEYRTIQWRCDECREPDAD
jgi:hypothetical protein